MHASSIVQTAPATHRTGRCLALLNAQWRGGSTLAEQLLFSTTVSSPFLLDEPAKAIWQDQNHHSPALANFNALRCDFHQFNHSLLLSWQHWRGEFTAQRRLLHFKSFADLQRRCHNAGHSGYLRAIKTIRMTGELAHVGRECLRHRTDGSNFTCVLLQLVRHPLSTLKSELASSQLSLQAMNYTRGTSQTEIGTAIWAESRARNMTEFCAPILKDVKAVRALQRRRTKALRRADELQRIAQHGHGRMRLVEEQLEKVRRELEKLPKAMLIRYDDLIRQPETVVRAAHALMQVYTSRAKLVSFIRTHLDAHYNSTGTSALSNVNYSSHHSEIPRRMRNRLKVEFGTVRPPRTCNTLQPMLDWPVCAELVRLMHPLYMC